MDFYDKKFYDLKKEELDFNFDIVRRGSRFSLIHRVVLSKDKKAFEKGESRPATYKAYKDYLSSLKDKTTAIDYPSYKRFIAYMNYSIAMRVIHKQKSFVLPFLGVLKTYKRRNKEELAKEINKKISYRLSLKLNSSCSNYAKRYSFKCNRFYKRLLEFLVKQEEENWFRDSYHFIKTKV